MLFPLKSAAEGPFCFYVPSRSLLRRTLLRRLFFPHRPSPHPTCGSSACHGTEPRRAWHGMVSRGRRPEVGIFCSTFFLFIFFLFVFFFWFCSPLETPGDTRKGRIGFVKKWHPDYDSYFSVGIWNLHFFFSDSFCACLQDKRNPNEPKQ